MTKKKVGKKNNGIINLINNIRYTKEVESLNLLYSSFDLQTYMDIILSNKMDVSYRDHLLRNTLRLTKSIAPRIFKLHEEIQKTIGFADFVEYYLAPAYEIQGYSVKRRDEDEPHIIVLSSGLLERMNDDEILFVLGHEMGHIIYNHHDPLLIYNLDSDEHPLPPLLRMKLLQWDREAEVSADRIGFITCKGNLSVVGSAFFKLVSNLSEHELHFDVRDYLKQLSAISKTSSDKTSAFSTHPINPIRIQALKFFWDSEPFHKIVKSVSTKKGISLKEVDERVNKFMGLMEYSPNKKADKAAMSFIAAAGLTIAASGGEVGQTEYNLLAEILLNYTSEPEEVLQYSSAGEIKKAISQNAAYIRKRCDLRDKSMIFSALTEIALADGKIAEAERNFLKTLAKQIGFKWEIAVDILSSHLAHLGTPTMKAPKFPLRKHIKRKDNK